MIITRELLFEEEKFFPSCHASTVLPLDGGDVLVCYFAGTREGANDVGIWLSRRVGGVWLDPVRIAKVSDQPHWNPVLMPIPGGARLIFKVGPDVPSWKSWTATSKDGGASWSAPLKYLAPNDACGPVRNKPLYLSDGSMLAPDSVETQADWRPRIGISYDYGASFPAASWIPIRSDGTAAAKDTKAVKPDPANHMAGKGAIQPTIWEGAPGHIHALLRTTAGFVFRSDSEDYGRSWCTAYNTRIPNNNSGIDLAKLDGKLYLVLNPVSGNWGDRTPIAILRSSDNGKTFDPYAVLEDMKDDPKSPPPGETRKHNAEFSYPAIVAKGGKLYITYTYLRRSIAYREITP